MSGGMEEYSAKVRKEEELIEKKYTDLAKLIIDCTTEDWIYNSILDKIVSALKWAEKEGRILVR